MSVLTDCVTQAKKVLYKLFVSPLQNNAAIHDATNTEVNTSSHGTPVRPHLDPDEHIRRICNLLKTIQW